MNNKPLCDGLSDWELRDWIDRLGSNPIRLVTQDDRSQSYEMNRASIFELENGQFAGIFEFGCSCYDSKDAQIDLFPSEQAALGALDSWFKEHKL